MDNPRLHAQWLRTRRDLLRQIKNQVRGHLGDESEALRSYAEKYERELNHRWEESTKEELLKVVAKSDLVFGADFHPFAQSQRTHLRILRDLPRKRKVILGLEAIGSRYQDIIDGFIRGSVSENDFLERVDWQRNWGFPWEHYKPLFSLAQEGKFEIVGLNLNAKNPQTLSLQQRDQHAAEIIIKLINQTTNGELIYVVFGDLHLATKHLPGLVLREPRAKEIQWLTIFQNSERIFFQLAKAGLESQVDVVRLDRNRYCVLGAPPWIQWQSYLVYLEHNFDRDLEEGDEEGDKVEDFSEIVESYVRVLANDLSIDTPLPNFSIYGSTDERFWISVQKKVNKRDFHLIRAFMKNEISFWLPQQQLVYLARASMNHAAHIAGELLHAHLNGRSRYLWNQPKDFLPLIWVEAMAFFLSKWINFKRSAETLVDLKLRLKIAHPSDRGREALTLALAQKMQEVSWAHERRSRIKLPALRRRLSYFEAARILGAMLGEKIFFYYRAGMLKQHEIMELLKHPVNDPEFKGYYKSVLVHIESLPSLEKSRGERL